MVRPKLRFPVGQCVEEGKPKLEVSLLSVMTLHMGFARSFPEIQALGKQMAAEYGLLPGEPGTWILLDHATLDNSGNAGRSPSAS